MTCCTCIILTFDWFACKERTNNSTQFKTVAKICNTVVAATSFLMQILVLFVSVSLLCSVTDTTGTKIGIKNDVAATTVLQISATILNWVLLFCWKTTLPWLVRDARTIFSKFNTCMSGSCWHNGKHENIDRQLILLFEFINLNIADKFFLDWLKFKTAIEMILEIVNWILKWFWKTILVDFMIRVNQI